MESKYGVALENVMILKRIVDMTGAKIVATTSNKYSLQRPYKVGYYESKYYNDYVKPLSEMGVQIYDMTPMVDSNRTLEIKKYLEEHQVEQYVIIDDDLIGEELQEHQVFLDLYKGLLEEHIAPAIRILNGELGFYPPDCDRSETPEELIVRINRYYNGEKRGNK